MEIKAKVTTSGPFWVTGGIETNIERQVVRKLSSNARALLAALIAATPVGATHALQKGWMISGTGLSVEITNEVPYITEVELGKKPGPQSVKALKAWVEVKLGIGPPRSFGVARAIAAKKMRVPTPGQFFVSNTYLRMVPPIQKSMSEITFTA